MRLSDDFPKGFKYLPGYFSSEEQKEFVDTLRYLVKEAPLFTPVMPRTGKPFSVRMTNLGTLGWVSDRSGYRYQSQHPETGQPWPVIPEVLQALWNKVGNCPAAPEACLVNYYAATAKMGMHQDRDEKTFEAPVVSVSLGDTAIFRLGGVKRGGPTQSLKLNSGDIVVLGGEARLCYHGIDRIQGGSSSLLKDGGRLNLTLRRISPF
ncbi:MULTISPECIES: alpha-ketoglutarate-dependent dioxygenase AlkB [unclassified Pseudovibrio]|uniref:alpha-ketoglutarate-dependent dioxygenase AlkB family protein n=1 Tax=unclassified Pseudovibrio TaxID=2627060 RepID=UPI0007AE5E48|nr:MULTISPECIES: alpha-ketoglutarate-dependent dioxygenase AlkB [unclassified Pseudovibrio]KZL03253.1 Alpha-ketoglutarate-dependent dioxygenase AlkB [Pseudovibrio sp. W74]KZL12293.1 Alpha-ketoglutarate-dependent dioxygenase AlkB [Pseudovibrio sp. Ad14]